MVGSIGADTLLGEADNDELAGRAGNDSLDGGDGIDTYDASDLASITLSTISISAMPSMPRCQER